LVATTHGGDRKEKVAVEKVEDGYYAVVRGSNPNTSPDSFGESADHQALEALIPNLGRTRALCLNSASAYQLSGIVTLRQGAGELARSVGAGNCRAFAVVDPEVFAEGVSAEFRAAGWKVERTGQDMRVNDGHFTEQFSLLRGIVQMVLSSSNR
jgi:hypothetical protein